MKSTFPSYFGHDLSFQSVHWGHLLQQTPVVDIATSPYPVTRVSHKKELYPSCVLGMGRLSKDCPFPGRVTGRNFWMEGTPGQVSSR